MKRKSKVMVALHLLIISILMFFMLGSPFYLLINVLSFGLIFIEVKKDV